MIVLVNSHILKIKLGLELGINETIDDNLKLEKDIGEFLLTFELSESFFKRPVVVFVDHVEIRIFFKDSFETEDVGIGQLFYYRVKLLILINLRLVLGRQQVLHVSQLCLFGPPKRIFSFLVRIEHFYHEYFLFIFVFIGIHFDCNLIKFRNSLRKTCVIWLFKH